MLIYWEKCCFKSVVPQGFIGRCLLVFGVTIRKWLSYCTCWRGGAIHLNLIQHSKSKLIYISSAYQWSLINLGNNILYTFGCWGGRWIASFSFWIEWASRNSWWELHLRWIWRAYGFIILSYAWWKGIQIIHWLSEGEFWWIGNSTFKSTFVCNYISDYFISIPEGNKYHY